MANYTEWMDLPSSTPTAQRSGGSMENCTGQMALPLSGPTDTGSGGSRAGGGLNKKSSYTDSVSGPWKENWYERICTHNIP